MTVMGVWLGGAGVGFGVWFLLVNVVFKRASLADTVSSIRRPIGMQNASSRERMLTELERRMSWSKVEQDLALLGLTREQHLTTRVVSVMAGLAFSLFIFLLVGGSFNASVLMILMIGCAAGGWFFPMFRLKERSVAARRDWRRALTGMVELIRALVSAGSDIRSATVLASRSGTSPLLSELRRRVEQAVSRNEPLESVFSALGDEIGVPELVDIAALMEMVNSGGIDPRLTMEAKSSTLRSAELADLRAEVAASTQHMSFPLVMMAFSFVTFLGYPALSVVTRIL